jgi:hypothetical protein
MRKTLIALAAAALCASLSGCAGLNVSGSLVLSYNTNVNAVTQTQHATSPGNEK